MGGKHTHAQCNWSCNGGGFQQTALEMKGWRPLGRPEVRPVRQVMARLLQYWQPRYNRSCSHEKHLNGVFPKIFLVLNLKSTLVLCGCHIDTNKSSYCMFMCWLMRLTPRANNICTLLHLCGCTPMIWSMTAFCFYFNKSAFWMYTFCHQRSC